MGTIAPRLILGAVVGLFAAAPHAFAQMATLPSYNPASEVTLTGVIQTVTEAADAYQLNGIPMPGTRLSVKTSNNTTDVRLGPSLFLEQQDLDLVPGSVVRIEGSRVTMGNAGVVLARRITIGRTIVVLRDTTGAPQWGNGAS
jgi:hypothetical protein